MGRYRDRWYMTSIAALCAIVLIGTGALVVGGSSSEAESPHGVAPAATSTPEATPPATATPDPVTLDYARSLDLNTIREALVSYAQAHGAFPSTDGAITTLCDAPDGAGCALAEIDAGVPFDDGTSPYWYASDGDTYTLIARASLPQSTAQSCPDELPDDLADGPLMCTSGRGD